MSSYADMLSVSALTPYKGWYVTFRTWMDRKLDYAKMQKSVYDKNTLSSFEKLRATYELEKKNTESVFVKLARKYKEQ